MAATDQPSPIATPLIAGIDMRAPASAPSRRRSQWTWLPPPAGAPEGRTPRRRPFKDGAGVVGVVLHHPGEIRMTRAGGPQGAGGAALPDRHLLLPAGPLGVVHHDRHPGTEGTPETDPAEDLHPILLDGHPPPPPVAESPPGGPLRGAPDRDLQTGRGAPRHRPPA